MGRWKLLGVPFLFLFLTCTAWATEVVNPVNATVVLRHICKGTEFKLVIPKGTTDFRVQIQNADPNYSCVGPYITGVFSCSNDGISSNVVEAGNIVSYYSSNGHDFSPSDGGVAVGSTFSMDPLGGSSLLFFVHSDAPVDEDCYFLFRADSYISSVVIDVERQGSTGYVEKDYKCDPAKECKESKKKAASNKKPNPKMPKSGKKYASGGSSGSSSPSSSSSQECHWELRCPGGATYSYQEGYAGETNCYYVRVCKPSSSPSSSPPSSGCKVNPPFNFNRKSPYDYNPCDKCSGTQQKSASNNPFSGAFSAKRRFCIGGSSCSGSGGGGASSGGTGGDYYEPSPAYPEIKGKQMVECDAKCISDNTKPKFYTTQKSYNLGDRITAVVYIPKFNTKVDVYLAAVNIQKEEYWIITMNGDTAVSYKLTEGGTVRAYATDVSNTINEWFYLDKVVPLERAEYRLYALVVPAGANVDDLKDYILSYYEFSIH